MKFSSVIISLADTSSTQQLGVLLGKLLSEGSVILLEGDLGAGKTTIIQGIGRGLDITEPIVSPTFTLINEYTEGRLPLYHLDLYRLQGDEIEALYPEMYWEGSEVKPGITAIEWAQRLPYKPERYIHLRLTYTIDGGRQAYLHLVGKPDVNLSLLEKLARENQLPIVPCQEINGL
ncbi:tRNA (adenosine(37)-N6)-threonylcarbamoyltransferase complex ATPase subunit type 1 TsaE [Pleurocapsales cyanobacterium LEGE 06147]|nr:tRNA (adenosine(37)-N6)-threonylcarbamoyltransferase complex ATPase subunit type 1 TsaE [Pleurocapsales cyanobacterium LEGE 06147]